MPASTVRPSASTSVARLPRASKVDHVRSSRTGVGGAPAAQGARIRSTVEMVRPSASTVWVVGVSQCCRYFAAWASAAGVRPALSLAS